MPTTDQINVRRRCRIALGATLLAGAAALVYVGFGRRHLAIPIVVATWPCALVAGWLPRVLTRPGPERDAHGVAALILPVAGVVLMLPITMGLPQLRREPDYLEVWMGLAICHSTFLVMGALLRAVQLVRGLPAWSTWRVYAHSLWPLVMLLVGYYGFFVGVVGAVLLIPTLFFRFKDSTPAEGSRPWPSAFVMGAVVLAALIVALESRSLVLFVGGLFSLPAIRAMGPIAVRERLQIARTPPVAITHQR